MLALARRQAFDSYMRYGRVPDLALQAADYAVRAVKALNPQSAVSITALPRSHPTTHYVWRTAGDERVRRGHAARDGQIFAWDHLPAGGHPGTEPNCRCWAERYYGDPEAPDAADADAQRAA